MAWLETSPVEQREQFIRDHRVGLYTMAELCARYDAVGRPATNGSRASTPRAAPASRIAAERRTTARTGSRWMSPR